MCCGFAEGPRVSLLELGELGEKRRKHSMMRVCVHVATNFGCSKLGANSRSRFAHSNTRLALALLWGGESFSSKYISNSTVVACVLACLLICLPPVRRSSSRRSTHSRFVSTPGVKHTGSKIKSRRWNSAERDSARESRAGLVHFLGEVL